MKLILLCGLMLWMLSACDNNTNNNTNTVNNENNANNINNNNNYHGSPCTGPADSIYCTIEEAIVLCGLGQNGYQEFALELCNETPDSFCYDGYIDPYCINPGGETCEIEDELQCSGTVIQRCIMGKSGHLWWIDKTDCSSDGKSCGVTDDGIGCIECELTAPVNPVPSTDATDIDPKLLFLVSWDASDGADFYKVYFGDSCPPPAYPDDAFLELTSTMFYPVLSYDTTYCWQVIAISNNGCKAAGEVWTFTTTSFSEKN